MATVAAIDSLTDITVFIRIAAAGSLSAAGRELGMSLAVVSKRLARLEHQLGVTLINRTTRRMSLTDEGLEFQQRCVRIVAELEEAQDCMTSRKRKASGLLRVTATAGFARRQIGPRLARFNALYPDVRVQLIITDTVVDLVRTGIDLAIREAPLPDSTLMLRRLAPNYRVPVASPDYLARRGMPLVPQDLLQHDCVIIGEPPITVWRFEGPGLIEPVAVEVSGTVLSNDGEVGHAVALGGSGIVLKSIWDVAEDLEAGHLVRVLPAYRGLTSPIQAVYPAGRLPAAKLSVFLDFLAAELKAAYRWDEEAAAAA